MLRGYQNFEPYLMVVTDTAEKLPQIPIPEKAKVKNPEAIFVQAPVDNTQRIVIGTSQVQSDLSVGASVLLEPGGSAILPMKEETEIYAVSTVTGQQMLVTYLSGLDGC